MLAPVGLAPWSIVEDEPMYIQGLDACLWQSGVRVKYLAWHLSTVLAGYFHANIVGLPYACMEVPCQIS